MAESAHPTSELDGARSRLGEVITEFGRHLDTLADQLGASLMEADRECVSVGESFHELAAAKRTIDGIAGTLPASTVLKDTARQMGDSIHAAVVALQYHDRLAQRLSLVRAGLVRLQTLLHTDPGRSHDDWLKSLRHVDQVNRAERLRLGPETAPGAAVAPRHDESSSVELF